jgi:hypothetical protein
LDAQWKIVKDTKVQTEPEPLVRLFEALGSRVDCGFSDLAVSRAFLRDALEV